MRLLVFLLVFVNLSFFAYGHGYFGHGPEIATRESQQIQPEAVRIVGHGAEPPQDVAPVAGGESPVQGGGAGDPALVSAPALALTPAPAPTPTPAPTTAPTASTAVPTAVPTTVPTTVPTPSPQTTSQPTPPAPPSVAQTPAQGGDVCLVWKSLSGGDAAKLTALIPTGVKISRKVQASGEANHWWVFIPPLPGKPEAERKAQELKAMGVDDYFIVQEQGPNRFAISLGVFSTEGAAQEALEDLKGKGVRSARVAVRSNPKTDVVAIQVKAPAERVDALRRSAAKTLPGQTPESCQ